MPLYKTITVNPTTKVLIWKLEESLEKLSEGICLGSFCKSKFNLLKSENHQKQFLSIRHLLAEAGYTDKDMYYDELGKPHLNDHNYISITHSYGFTGIIIGIQPVGIDIEKQRDKIMRIANKFTPFEEYNTLANDEAIIRKLTIVWGAKEAIYKIMNLPGISFLNHIYVEDFDFNDLQTTAELNFNNIQQTFTTIFIEFEGFTCVYALYSEHK